MAQPSCSVRCVQRTMQRRRRRGSSMMDGMPRAGRRRDNLLTIVAPLLCVAGFTLSQVYPAQAQFGFSLSQRAADGTVYQVISVPNAVLLSNVDEFRVTTVAGGPLGLGGCTTPGG